MKSLTGIFVISFFLLHSHFAGAQVVNKTLVNPPTGIVEKPDLRNIEIQPANNLTITVNTWSAGKISASQAVISYSIRCSDTAQPVEHGVCYSTTTNPAVSNPKTAAKGYTTNTLYGELNSLKPGMKYYVKAYMKLLNTGVIYYGNEINFTTLASVTK